jgi:hypothetical protein
VARRQARLEQPAIDGWLCMRHQVTLLVISLVTYDWVFIIIIIIIIIIMCSPWR